MVPCWRGVCGGIRGLRRLLADRECREAVESDLIDRGLRLRNLPSPDLNWRDLWVIVRHLPTGSALNRVQDPDWRWDLHAQLGAGMYDLLAGANWQRSGDNSAERPTPLPRPGLDTSESAVAAPKKTASEVRALVANVKSRNRKIAGRH